MFHGYFDEQSRCLAAFTGYRIREDPPHMGQTSLGVSRQNPAVIEAMTRFLTAVGYRGIVSVGCRFDPRDGQYKLLDVNPRIGGAFRMFVDANGLDVARVAYLDLTGQQVPAVVPRDGRRWFREDAELVSLRRYRQLEGLRFRDWLRSYRGVEEGSTFSLRDPLPFVCSMTLLAGYTIGGRWQRWRARRQLSGQSGRHGAVAEQQRMVDQYFENEAPQWKEIYRRGDTSAKILQHRQALALAWTERLALPPGSRVLDVGCGPGLTAVALAKRGLMVDALDPVVTMIEITRQHAAEAGLDRVLTTHLGDVHSLEFEDDTFSLVVALGVVTWLHSPSKAMREMARVLKPGGWFIANCISDTALTRLIDPLDNSSLAPARKLAKRVLQRLGLRRPAEKRAREKTYQRREFDQLISSVGLEQVEAHTFGFGPFSMFGRPLLPDALGLRLHCYLQKLADGGVPGLRLGGFGYIVLARKAGGA
jgi:ubiquinone/menaquinone biosynthesis C-methylase UbiE